MLGDHLGRKPILALGFLLNSTLSLGLIVFHQFSLIAPAAILAGLGSAFIAPALGASYLDITVPQQRSVIQGIRESAVSFSAVASPLPALVVLKLQDRVQYPASSRDYTVRKTDHLVSAS
jgi:MFS family permease